MRMLEVQLQHTPGCPRLKDILTPVLLCEAYSLFAKSDELMPQLSAEAGVTAPVGVIIRPVAVILKDAVPGSPKEIPDTVSIMTGQDFKS